MTDSKPVSTRAGRLAGARPIKLGLRPLPYDGNHYRMGKPQPIEPGWFDRLVKWLKGQPEKGPRTR